MARVQKDDRGPHLTLRTQDVLNRRHAEQSTFHCQIYRSLSVSRWPHRIRVAGVSRPYSIKDKVVTIDLGDIVDNKRLSQVLRTAQIVQSQRDDRVGCRPSIAHRVDGTPSARNKIAGAKRQRNLSEDDLHSAIKDTMRGHWQEKEITC